MKKSGKSLLFLALVVLLISSCKKEKTDPNAQGQAEFTVSLSQLKSTLTDPIASNLAFVVVSIEDEKGNVVKNSEKIELYNMQGNYISKPLGLVVGNYKLTCFLVLDRDNNVVYASPVNGSAKAYLVQKPLPVSFTVTSNDVVKVTPEVLKTVDRKPEDFGYSTFGFDVAQSFDFLLGVFVYDNTAQNFGLTTAQLKVTTDGTVVYESALNAYYSKETAPDILAITDKITLPERYSTYTIQVSKAGYKTYSKTFSKEDLRKYFLSVDNGPLVVVLEESGLNDGLVVYLKFNGDSKDYSGNNNDGTYYGGIFDSDRKGYASNAINLNGSSNYVLLKNSPALNPINQISVCAWYYAESFYGNGANSLVSKRRNLSDIVEYQYHLDLISDSYKGNLNDPHLRHFEFRLTTSMGEARANTTGLGGDFPYTYYQYKLHEWNFVVGTYDGNTIKLYVNGVLMASNNAVTGNMFSSANDIYIGKTQNTEDRPYYDYTKGKIDDVRIYNRALNQEEILMLYNE